MLLRAASRIARDAGARSVPVRRDDVTTTTNNSTQLQAAAGSGYEQVWLTASAELMQNNAASRAVDATHPIRVAQNLDGEPIIFSVGTADAETGADSFYVITRRPDGDTGWQQIDLSAGLGADLKVNAFAVSQSSTGAITLALAVESAAEPGVSRLYITAALANDPTQVDWSNFSSQWVARPSTQDGLTVKEILLGTSDDKAGPPTIVVSTAQAGQDDSYWLVDGDTSHTDAASLWKQYHLPENTRDLIDLAIGSLRAPYGRGIYTLYGVGSDMALVFNTLTPGPFGTTYSIDLTAPPGARALCPAPNSEGYSDLYVAGDGLYVFPSGRQTSGATAATIADAQTTAGMQGLEELLVATDDENVSIWTKGNQEALLYVTGLKGADPQWSYPLSLRSNVAQIAALRNRVRQANEIFIVDGNNSLAYLWQDPATTLWQETDIPLPDTGEVQTFNCYTTFINFADQDGNPIIDEAVQLTASGWTYVTVNGAFYELGADPVTVATDVQGTLNIVNKVTSIATPFFHLRANFFEQVVDINPAAKIQYGLGQIQSGDDLKNAPTQDGKPLLTQEVDDDTLDSVAQGVQQLIVLTDTLPADGTTPAADGFTASAAQTSVQTSAQTSVQTAPTVSHVSVRAAGDTPRNRIRTAHLPAGYCWGMTFERGRARYHEGAVARSQFLSSLPGAHPPAGRLQGAADNVSLDSVSMAALSVSDPFDAVPAIAGDVLESLSSGLEEAGGFLIQAAGESIEFIINLGDRVVKLTLDTVEQVLKAIDWLFQTIYVLLLDFLRWLGLLFNWDDILTTQRVFANVTNQTINMLESKIALAESEVDNFFAKLKQQAQQNLKPLPGDLGSLNLKELSRSVPASVTGAAKTALDFMSGSPGGNFGAFQLLYSGMLNMEAKAGEAGDGLDDFIENVLTPAVENIPQAVFDIVESLQQSFTAGTLTVNDVIMAVAADAAIAMIDMLHVITVGLLKIAAALLEDFRAILNDEIDVPFLTALYEWATGGKFTLLNGVTLLFSIPTTTFYKLVANAAPFAEGTYGLDTDGYEQLFKTLTGGATAPAAHTEMSAANALTAAPEDSEASSSSQEGGVSEGAMKYSQVGGALYVFTQVANGLLNIYAARNVKPEETVPDNKMRWLSLIHLGINSVYVSSSFPVKVGETVADDLETGVWAVDVLGLVVDLACFAWGQVDPQKREGLEKVVGGYEVGEGVFDLILYSMIYGFEVTGENDAAAVSWHSVKYAQNFLYAMSCMMYGSAILDENPETKAIELALGGGFNIGAGILHAPRLIYDIVEGEAHESF
jgi:hypothetical protein